MIRKKDAFLNDKRMSAILTGGVSNRNTRNSGSHRSSNQRLAPMGEQAAKLLEKINANQLNVSALISSPQLISNNYCAARKNKRVNAYEGYSNRERRGDRVELILSTLDNNLREKKYVDTSTYR